MDNPRKRPLSPQPRRLHLHQKLLSGLSANTRSPSQDIWLQGPSRSLAPSTPSPRLATQLPTASPSPTQTFIRSASPSPPSSVEIGSTSAFSPITDEQASGSSSWRGHEILPDEVLYRFAPYGIVWTDLQKALLSRALKPLNQDPLPPLRDLSLGVLVPCGAGKTIVVIASMLATIERKGGGMGLIVTQTSGMVSWRRQFRQYYPDVPFVSVTSEGEKSRARLCRLVKEHNDIGEPYFLAVTYTQLSNKYLDRVADYISPVACAADEFKLRYTSARKAKALQRVLTPDTRVIIPVATPQQNLSTDLPVTALALGMSRTFGCTPDDPLTKLSNAVVRPYTIGRKGHIRALFSFLNQRAFVTTSRPRSYRRERFVLSIDGHDGQNMEALIAEAGVIAARLPETKRMIADLERAIIGADKTQGEELMASYGLSNENEARDFLAKQRKELKMLQERRQFLDRLDKQPRVLTKGLKQLIDHFLDNINTERHPFLLFAHSLRLRTDATDHLRARGLKVAKITGRTPDEARTQIFEDFQNNKYDAMLMGMCANDSITLTAARYALMIPEIINPAVGEQFEGRIDRIEQKAPFIARYDLVVRGGYTAKIFTLMLLVRRAATRNMRALENRSMDEFYDAFCAFANKRMVDLRKLNFNVLVAMACMSDMFSTYATALLDDIDPSVVGIRTTLLEREEPSV